MYNSLDGLWDIFDDLNLHEEQELNLFLDLYQNNEDDMATSKYTMTKKTKLNPPKPFTGKWTDLQCFIQETFVFLTINKEHYNTDDKKIAFVMLFMNDGDASIWEQEYISRIMKDDEDQGDDISFGTYKAFMNSLEKSFSPYDGPGDALEEMKQLRFSNDKSIDKDVSKFKLLVAQSGLGQSLAVIDLFGETLPYSLQRPIITTEFAPTTLDGWFDKAIIFHNNWKKAQRYLGQGRNQEEKKKEEPKREFFYPPKWERDPNAMDINWLSIEEWNWLMKEGRCFRCKNIGHMSRDCVPGTMKLNRKTATTQIRALIAQLDQEEKAKLRETAETKGLNF